MYIIVKDIQFVCGKRPLTESVNGVVYNSQIEAVKECLKNHPVGYGVTQLD